MKNFERLNEEINAIRRQRYQFLLLNYQQSNEKELDNAFEKMGIPSINVNKELAIRLKDVPISRRQRVVKDELQHIINEFDNDVIFLNRIQYLFDEELKQDLIRLIEYISGNKVILIDWPGEVAKGSIKYGTPNHPEYFEADGLEDHIIQI
ncbi:BREX-3 system P-loop-containing protein BrxF [Schinkia azotoformans]|uniref:BREX-3 system P-loop-containing protein BrxF n=1 Tax=Schinkia azotoformans TaxID=1454 RepID=UPI002DB96485|nr:BREX-3 system P-loop-containing protein BrxF [Schinkia azotoformans]MEC1782119.1 BREX-3 system P-loop-containing protein BrxF [Schinkia azotoformans]MED4329563.1 BREX-3 system P-loop-containing protein BrxF [Schinkia azotoformans]